MNPDVKREMTAGSVRLDMGHNGCRQCDFSGFVQSEKGVKPCACKYRMMKIRAIRQFWAKLPARFKFYEIRPNQTRVKQKIASAGRGVWLHGPSDWGKSTLIWRAIRHVQKRHERPLFVWVGKIKKLMSLWFEQYESPEARQELRAIFEHSILYIDDVDKMTFTGPRESEFFSLIDDFAERKKWVFFTSNSSIDGFCKQMAKSGPMKTRLKELCEEIKGE